MRNTLLLFLIVMICALRGAAQTMSFNDSLSLSRNAITRSDMVGLGSFAVANIISGFAIGAATTGETRYFWRMNGYWNIVNLGVAGLGYLGANKAFKRTYTLAQNEAAQLAVEKTYVLNFGLDMVYITGGFYLRERGNSETNPDSRNQYKGYGTSISVQGGFLLLMDGVMVLLHHKNSIRLNKRLTQLALSSAPGGVGLSYSF
jgi:hypothetical protein